MDDMSDFDMDDIMESQEPVKPKQGDVTTKASTSAPASAERDEFEDEIEAMNDMNDLY